ncbi:MAG: hypothetical protein ACODAB_08640 [Gemmatimonadota bacterium]
MNRFVRSAIVPFVAVWAVGCGAPDGAREVEPEPAARILGHGVISTGEAADELQPSISADGRTLFFARRVPDGRFTLFAARRGSTDDPDDWTDWDEPEMLPFSGDYDDQEPFISADGRRLYFTSNRPAPGSEQANRGREPWVVERTRGNGSGWGEPRPVDPDLTLEPPDTPDLSRFWGQPRGPVEGPDGSLYFWAERPDTRGHTDLYRVEPDTAGGGYGEPVNLGPPVSSERYETSAAFAPDGSWIIFGRDEDEDGYGLGDLYGARRIGDGWTGAWGEPRNLGPLVNSPAFDASPAVTSNGRFLLFSSNRSIEGEGTGRHNIYVIELERLELE